MYVTVALMLLAPLWNAPGLPFSHEGPAFVQRTQIYLRHWAWMDLFPIWSSADVFGFGSPMPAMYHKLFYLLAAPLAMLVGSMKAALIVAVAIVLVIGAIGMDRLTRRLGAGELAAIVAGCSLLAANYTVTNWLVRGAVAEVTAAMLVPWLLLFFSRALDLGRMPLGLGVALGLMWLAHSVLALYAVLLLAVTFLLMATTRATSWSLLDPRTAWPAVAASAALIVPYLVPMTLLGGRYDLSRFLSAPMNPSHQFRPLHWYFWDQHWRFGRTLSGLTMQIDLPLLALLAVGSVGLTRLPRADRARLLRQVAPCAVVVVLCLLLQLQWTEPFYQHVPGAKYIQFPWRLLALLTPALIALSVVTANRGFGHDTRLVVLAATGAWMVAGSGALVPIVDRRLAIEAVSVARVSFSGFREYEPVAAPPIAESQRIVAERWDAAGCRFVRDAPGEEVRAVRVDVLCGRGATLPLPLYASDLHRVEVSTFGRSVPCLSLPDTPSLCGVVLQAGHSVVTVTMPSMRAIPGLLWARLTSNRS